MYDSTLDNSIISDQVSAESDLLDDEINEKILPTFQTGARDINSVMSSSFIIGKSIIKSAKVKSLAKFDSELRYKLIPVAQARFDKHLQWNEAVIINYMNMIKTFYIVKSDIDEYNYRMAAKNLLWPFTVLDFHKANLGAMQGAINTSGKDNISSTQKVLGGALSGAATGAMVGGPTGALAGGVLGGLAGLF